MASNLRRQKVCSVTTADIQSFADGDDGGGGGTGSGSGSGSDGDHDDGGDHDGGGNGSINGVFGQRVAFHVACLV